MAINGLGAVVTGAATIIFLATKFTEGAWLVVVAIPLFILLFHRVERYYQRSAAELGFGRTPGHPSARPTTVVVPVAGVSELTEVALSEALSLGDHVVAISVFFEGEEKPLGHGDIEADWRRWDPGVPLEVLHTEYSSVVRPIVAYIDRLLERHDCQVVVLIPVVVPDRARYRILHNQMDVALKSALRSRTDVVVARVSMPLSTPILP